MFKTLIISVATATTLSYAAGIYLLAKPTSAELKRTEVEEDKKQKLLGELKITEEQKKSQEKKIKEEEETKKVEQNRIAEEEKAKVTLEETSRQAKEREDFLNKVSNEFKSSFITHIDDEYYWKTLYDEFNRDLSEMYAGFSIGERYLFLKSYSPNIFNDGEEKIYLVKNTGKFNRNYYLFCDTTKRWWPDKPEKKIFLAITNWEGSQELINTLGEKYLGNSDNLKNSNFFKNTA